MGKTVKIPTPVYKRIKRQATNDDVPMGVVVRDWMTKAEKYDELERR